MTLTGLGSYRDTSVLVEVSSLGMSTDYKHCQQGDVNDFLD